MTDELSAEAVVTVRESVDRVLPLEVGERLLRQRLADRGLEQPERPFAAYERDFAADRPDRPFSPAIREEIVLMERAGIDRDMIRAHVASVDSVHEQIEIARLESTRAAVPTVERATEIAAERAAEPERKSARDLGRGDDESGRGGLGR